MPIITPQHMPKPNNNKFIIILFHFSVQPPLYVRIIIIFNIKQTTVVFNFGIFQLQFINV